MKDIFAFTALIQFIGAFNFAFVFEPIYNKLFDFLDIKRKILQKFQNAKSNIYADRDSVRIMTPIITVNGASTEGKLQELRDKFDDFFKRTDEDVLSKDIKERIKLKYVDSMFFMLSLYSVIDLFIIGWAEHLRVIGDISMLFQLNLSFFIFNVLTCCNILYQVFHQYKRRYSAKLLHWANRLPEPTLYRTGVTAILFVIISAGLVVLNGLYVKHFNPMVEDFIQLHNWSVYSGIALPFSGFVLSALMVAVKYRKSDACKQIKSITKEIENLHREKEDYCRLSSFFGEKLDLNMDNLETTGIGISKEVNSTATMGSLRP